jgi:UDP-N-acetylmuramoylalanine--D-glutamate ligase
MQDYKKFFKGKKITVMGLGLLGRGVGDAMFLAECGADLVVTDLKTKKELTSSLKKLQKFKNIKYTLGEHRLEDFRGRDMILKAAGVPFDSIYIKEAEKNKIPIEMSGSLLVKLSSLSTVGVTGTRGKSTVTHMIEHILKTAKKKIILGGNVRGVSNLQLLKKAKNSEVILLELDSWQLQGFGTNKISPNISIFTTFFNDHLKYYHGDQKKYFKDKANIFKYQKGGDVFVVGSQALPFIKKWEKETGQKIKGKIIVPKTKNIQLKIPGEHNIYNAALAFEATRAFGIGEKDIKKALAIFPGVPGRQEFIKEINGVKYYNDTTATTPEATLAALHTLGDQLGGKASKLVMIAGGSDKELDMNLLIKEIPKFCKKVILLPGTGTDTISKNLKVEIYKVNSMREAVKTAQKNSKKGDTVLLSPGFASFGLFKNEFDRGDQFIKAVKSLK